MGKPEIQTKKSKILKFSNLENPTKKLGNPNKNFENPN
jgi:hypothetical protein